MRNREKLMEVTGSLGERDEARTAKDTVHQVNKRAFPRTRETHKEDSDDRRNIHIRLADSTGGNCFGIQGVFKLHDDVSGRTQRSEIDAEWVMRV